MLLSLVVIETLNYYNNIILIFLLLCLGCQSTMNDVAYLIDWTYYEYHHYPYGDE